MIEKKAKIYIAGHLGLVGSAILNIFKENGFENFLLRTQAELDLMDELAVKTFFEAEKPEYVIIAAAKVGGIMANNLYRADFLYENLKIQNNLIHQSCVHGVKKLIFLGSSCIYPKDAPQPLKEDSLLTSELEYTNEPYAIAKIAGIKLCEAYNLQYNTNFVSLMPTNMYGPNDNFDLEKSHVFPAVIRKLHLGKSMQENNWVSIRKDLDKNPVENINGSSTEKDILSILKKYGITKEAEKTNVSFWGTGSPRREFLHSSDLAKACLFIFENIDFNDLIDDKSKLREVVKNISNTHLNIGTGKDISIKELVDLASEIIEYKGSILWDSSFPDGTHQKLMDVSKVHSLGWKEEISIREGIKGVYNILNS